MSEVSGPTVSARSQEIARRARLIVELFGVEDGVAVDMIGVIYRAKLRAKDPEASMWIDVAYDVRAVIREANYDSAPSRLARAKRGELDMRMSNRMFPHLTEADLDAETEADRAARPEAYTPNPSGSDCTLCGLIGGH